MPKISIVIPAYNEENTILDCLQSLLSQTEKSFEVIVVDDGSTDNTKKILQDIKFKQFSLLVVEGKHKGAGFARNKGAKLSKGKVLVFLDADMTFDKKFLKKLTAPILSGKSNGTWSKNEYVSNWENVWARCWNWNEGWVEKKRHPKGYPSKQHVFRAILKQEFDSVGGYDPGGYNDDWTLSKKLGYKANLARNAYFYHKNPETLSEVFSHAKWIGKRKYKFGILGSLVALVRSSLPVSVGIGFVKSIKYLEPRFIIFKVVYDLGVFFGIVKYILSGEGQK